MAVPYEQESLISSINVLGNPFSLTNLPEFPYSEFTEQTKRYAQYQDWFDGSMLDDTQTQGGQEIDIYPLRINPLRTACLKHAYALFGEFPDDISGTLVQPRVIVAMTSCRVSITSEEVSASLSR